MKTISRLVQGAFYIYAGVNHFLNPHFFTRIVPPWVPDPELANEVSGAAEIALGSLLLIPSTSKKAAWGLIALLIAVFPANWYQFSSGGAGMKVPRWFLIARLPLQLLLIAWAHWYTKD